MRSSHLLFEDAMQEGMIAVWKQIEKSGEISDGLAYTAARRRTFAVADGAALGKEWTCSYRNTANVASIEALPVESSMSLSIHDHSDQCTTAVMVREAVSSLPADTQHAVGMMYEHGFNLRSVAAALGVPETTFRWQWKREHRPALVRALSPVASEG